MFILFICIVQTCQKNNNAEKKKENFSKNKRIAGKSYLHQLLFEEADICAVGNIKSETNTRNFSEEEALENHLSINVHNFIVYEISEIGESQQ